MKQKKEPTANHQNTLPTPYPEHFPDKDFQLKDFERALRMCSKGVHPEMAMRALGKHKEYLHILAYSEAYPDSPETNQLSKMESHYYRSLSALLGNTYNLAMDSDGKTAISATKLLLELQEKLEHKLHPIVVKERDTGKKTSK